MPKIFQRIISSIFFGSENQEELSNFVIKVSTKLLFLQCFSIFLGFLLNYYLVKTIDLKDYGSYVYIFNLLALLVNICILGVDTLLVKKVPVYDTAKRYSELKGIIYFSIAFSIFGSIVIAGISTKLIGLVSNIEKEISTNWFLICFLSLIILSLLLLTQAILQGLRKLTLSQIGEKIFKPLLLLTIIAIYILLKERITLAKLIWLNIIVLGVTLVIAVIFLKGAIAFDLRKIKPKYDFINWTNSTMSFFFMSVLYILNSRVDIFLLGLFRGNDEVGIYNIVLKISEVLSLVLVIINYVLAPFITKLFENGELIKLQQLITRSAQAILLFSLPLLIIIILFSKNILVFFGVDFLNGQEALFILCVGQLFNILCGSVGLLLLMTGNQKYSITSLIVGVCVNIVLNIVLTPMYGMVGTAIATAASLSIWNCITYFFVRKKLKIHTTAFRF